MVRLFRSNEIFYVVVAEAGQRCFSRGPAGKEHLMHTDSVSLSGTGLLWM
jgi:hypothetical protein